MRFPSKIGRDRLSAATTKGVCWHTSLVSFQMNSVLDLPILAYSYHRPDHSWFSSSASVVAAPQRFAMHVAFGLQLDRGMNMLGSSME